MHDVVSGYANGTTVNMLPIDAIQKPEVVRPPKGLVAVFDAVAVQTARRVEALVSESRTLVALRDVLLPKLISGELRIRDAERLADLTETTAPPAQARRRSAIARQPTPDTPSR